MTMNPQPPAPPFGQSAPVPPGAGSPPPGWSASAITGFVLSIVGCLIVTGVLGLIFGIVGIIKTGDGRRRGRGLAIAAIPISIITTALGILVAYGFNVTMTQMAANFTGVAKLLQNAPDQSGIESVLQNHCSASFRDSVSPAKMREWLESTRRKHGSLVGKPSPQPVESPGRIAFKYDGKFVNGTAPIVVVFSQELLEFRVDDIQVDGQSPRQ